MRIGIIGAGKVGTAFGLFLKERGETIAGYASKTEDSAHRAAVLTDSRVFSEPLDLIRASDLILLTVVDDQIELLAASLAARLLEVRKNGGKECLQDKCFVHMSGAHSITALEPLAAAGYETATLHPLQSVSEVGQAAKTFGASLFTMEAQSGGRFGAWLATIGISYVRLKAEDKALYHAGAVFASNFVVTLLDAAIRLFERIGFSEEEARRGLLPLVTGSIDNVGRAGAEQALTGPIARGDAATVAKHLEALSGLPETASLYRSLSVATLALAERHKLKEHPGAVAEFAALLSKEEA